MSKSLLMVVAMTVLSSSITIKSSIAHEPFAFVPLTQSGATKSMRPCTPLVLPNGFTQSILVQELPYCSKARITLDVVAETSDRTDMHTVNETGSDAGRYLYRTHEADEGRAAISVIDLLAGQNGYLHGRGF